MGQLSESEEKYLRLRVKHLVCDSVNGMRIRQFLRQPYMCWAGMQAFWKGQWLGAGDWGLWSNLRARAAVDCGETDRGDAREETAVGNACGGKLGQPWKQGDTAESCTGGGAITIASLPPTRQYWQLNNREVGPSNT